MEWWLISLILVGVLFILLGGGMFIAVGLVLIGLLGMQFFLPPQLEAAAYASWGSINSFTLTAIPLFIFMGEILLHSRISELAYSVLARWLGRIPGGLLHVNIGSCAIFAAISGSSVATAATIGTVSLPEMEKHGYDKRITYGSLAAGGTLGILIPPSITMIVYGSMTNVSVGKLFVAGFIPGFLLALIFMIFILSRSIANPQLAPKENEPFSLIPALKSLVNLLPIIALVLVVMGSIYLGITTPTEAAAIGALGSLVLCAIRRRLGWAVLRESLRATTLTSCMLLFIIAAAHVANYVFAYLNVGPKLVNLVLAQNIPPTAVMAAILATYLLLGCVFEGIAMMVMTLPYFVPIIMALGFDPLWFGIIVVIEVEIGLLTPPVGMNLFVIQGLRKGIDSRDVIIGTMPFVAVHIAFLALMTVFPQVVLWLPSKMTL